MGMEGKLRQVSEFELASYRKNPSKLYSDLMANVESESFTKFTSMMREFQASPVARRVQERAMSGLPPLQEDLDALQKKQETILRNNQSVLDEVRANMMGLSKDGAQLSLHKSWHCLHFLLTGKSWDPADAPLGNAIMGGTELPDLQRIMGYGPARYLTPSQVADIASALASFPAEGKAEAFHPEIAEEMRVYVPNHGKEELLYYFGLLKDFYQDAAKKGNAMILWVE